MKHNFGKKQLALSVIVGSFAIAATTVTPHAFAHSVQELEDQLQLQLNAIQKQLDELKSRSLQEAQKVKQIEQTTNQTEQEIKEIKQANSDMEERYAPDVGRTGRKNRMLFFRGGFTHAMQQRNGTSIRSEVAPVGAQDQAGNNGFYVGAGLDWNLTNNVWGAMPKTSVFAELMFEYKEFGNKVQGNALANAPTQLAGGALNPRNVTVSQFTLSAAPKIKFMEGSKLRPWIIPGGLALHVISPTSESVTYLTPGVMFGAGVDYHIWKNFYIGIDGRYNLTTGKADGVRVDGMTAGGYVGIGF